MRLATFNILHGRSMADGVVDLDRLRTAIATLDADVLALQEVDRDQPRSHLADLTEVAAAAMGAVSHRFVAAISGTPGATWIAANGKEVGGSASYGISLLSRYPAKAWQVMQLPRIPVRFPLWLPGPRKMIVVHEEPRCAVVGVFDTPAGPVTVANSHLSFIPRWNRLQLKRIARYLELFPQPALLMGDLNMQTPLPAHLTGFRALAAAPTFPVDRPFQQLDHILLKGSLGEVTSADAPVMPLSDHRALVVDLRV
jgi:endonuclease/exonuclease/phosphatase family metal-dependent hydrolase